MHHVAVVMTVNTGNALLVRGAILFLPIVLTLCFWPAALRARDADQKRVWGAYRKFSRFIIIGVTVIWSMVSQLVPGSSEVSANETLPFCAPLIASLAIYLFLCTFIDKIIYGLKWGVTNTLWQTWWKLVDFVFPLLMVATGFSSLLDKKITGVAWLFAAGAVSRIGSVFLRQAQGMKLNALKTGELRNRAFSIANGMAVTLSRVYSVPAGKGHLTSAYGMSNAIALTDNLGKYLTKEEKDYVIAHELAHVKLKHGRKHLLLVFTTYATTSVVLFYLPRTASFFPGLNLAGMIAALFVYYYFSRRFEYSADREAVAFTGDPEAAIHALATLQQTLDLTSPSDKFTELLMTHPTFAHRVRAIANRENITADGLNKIFQSQDAR
jgi:Zn-dependent protease with chaperone function